MVCLLRGTDWVFEYKLVYLCLEWIKLDLEGSEQANIVNRVGWVSYREGRHAVFS